MHSRLGLLLAAVRLLDDLMLEEDCLVRLVDLVAIQLTEIERVQVSRECGIKIRSVGDLTEDKCFRWTRFTKEQLFDIIPCLHLPNYFLLEYKYFLMKLSGETVLLLYLARLALGENFETLKLKFKLNPAYMGGFVHLMTQHLYTHFFHKISGRSILMWLPYVHNLRCMVYEKVIQPSVKEKIEYEEGTLDELVVLDMDFDLFRAFAYIDYTHVETSRPGAGPVGEGEGAPKREDAFQIQRAFCNT